LIAYRRRHDDLMDQVSDQEIETVHGGTLRLVVFKDRIDGREHAALVKGKVVADRPMPVRVHAINMLHDLVGLAHAKSRHGLLQAAMKRLAEWEEGVIVLLHDPEKSQISQGMEENASSMLREYGIGARILHELGVRQIELISNSPQPSLVALDGYGLKICGTRSL